MDIRINVLVVDDQASDAELFAQVAQAELAKQGLHVQPILELKGSEHAPSEMCRQAARIADRHEISIAVLDLCLSPDEEEDTTGILIGRDLKLRYPNCQLVLVTGKEALGFDHRNEKLGVFEDNVVAKRAGYADKELPNAIRRAGRHFVAQINRSTFLGRIERPSGTMWTLAMRRGKKGLQYTQGAEPDAMAIPPIPDSSVVVETWSLGICGTDVNAFGDPQAHNHADLIQFHEALGRVRWKAKGVGDDELRTGDIVVPVVRRCQLWYPPKEKEEVNFNFPTCALASSCTSYRRPDACPVGEHKPPRQEGYRSRGTGKCHGFGSEFFVDSPEWLVKVFDADNVHDTEARLLKRLVLAEPLAVVWKMKREIEKRRLVRPFGDRLLVLGLGPIGYLAALVMCTMYPGLSCLAVDKMPIDRAWIRGLKACLSGRLDYISLEDTQNWHKRVEEGRYDIVVEATGDPSEVLEGAIRALSPGGILAILSVAGEGANQLIHFDANSINRIVKGNVAIIGSVNEAREDFVNAVEFLRLFHGGPTSVLDNLMHRLQVGPDSICAVERIRHQAWKERVAPPKVVLETPMLRHFLSTFGLETAQGAGAGGLGR